MFNKFKSAKKASMICEKNENTGCYDCKMGFDSEAQLFRTNGFKYTDSVCDNEMDAFIKSLGAYDSKDVSDVKRFVVLDNKSNTDIYNFGGSTEIHFTKN